jgi:hypothetical protein
VAQMPSFPTDESAILADESALVWVTPKCTCASSKGVMPKWSSNIGWCQLRDPLLFPYCNRACSYGFKSNQAFPKSNTALSQSVYKSLRLYSLQASI